MNFFATKVIRKTIEAEDIASFELASVSGAPLPPFSAGAHIDVKINDHLTRQYSLCNDPTETHRYMIGVLRDPKSRGGSVAMHDLVAEGDTIWISEPKNHFPLQPASNTLLFAGGIGVTPILCMAERLAAIGAEFSMHYCSRNAQRTAFHSRIRSSSFANSVSFHFDDGPDAQKLKTAQVLANAVPRTHLYVCGPGGFIEHVSSMASAAGWHADHIHFEYFGAPPVETTGDTAFEVQIASTGKRYVVPADSSVVNALQRYGIDIPVSCEQGVCGTCITRLLGGTPEHRDMYFTEDEHAKNDQFTPCCSRASSQTLILDL